MIGRRWAGQKGEGGGLNIGIKHKTSHTVTQFHGTVQLSHKLLLFSKRKCCNKGTQQNVSPNSRSIQDAYSALRFSNCKYKLTFSEPIKTMPDVFENTAIFGRQL